MANCRPTAKSCKPHSGNRCDGAHDAGGTLDAGAGFAGSAQSSRRRAPVLFAAGSALALWGCDNVQAPAPRTDASAPEALAPGAGAAERLARGRYLVNVGGCNDCHTEGFFANGGTSPEHMWLKGSSVGWYGPWGTSYAINLRLFMQNMSEDDWLSYTRAATPNPAMPASLLRSLSEQDARDIHFFITSFKDKGSPAPARLGPGEKPTGAVVIFPGVPENPSA